MKVVKVPIDKLILDPVNARRHPERNLEAIKGSIARFGQQKPIVVARDHTVIAGNGTLEAMRALGKTEIDVVYSDLEGPERTAFGIADNKTSELAEWDQEVLAAHLGSLADFDPSLLDASGFTQADLDKISAAVDEASWGESGHGEDEDMSSRPDKEPDSTQLTFSVPLMERDREEALRLLAAIRDSNSLDSVGEALMFALRRAGGQP